jgi:hypothetical protein
MGVFACLLMFSNVENKLNFLRNLDSLTGGMRKYDEIQWILDEYNINLTIPLLFECRKIGIQEDLLQSILGKEQFILDIEVPVEHESFEGLWRVKEVKRSHILHYAKPEIENFAVILAQDNKAVKGTLRLLKKQGLYPLEVFVELPSGRMGLEVVKDLGSMGWVYVAEVANAHVKGAGFHGIRLQDSDYIEDLLKRGGRIKAARLIDQQRGVIILIGSEGTVYSYKAMQHEFFAREISKIIEVFKRRGLVRLK